MYDVMEWEYIYAHMSNEVYKKVKNAINALNQTSW